VGRHRRVQTCGTPAGTCVLAWSVRDDVLRSLHGAIARCENRLSLRSGQPLPIGEQQGWRGGETAISADADSLQNQQRNAPVSLRHGEKKKKRKRKRRRPHDWSTAAASQPANNAVSYSWQLDLSPPLSPTHAARVPPPARPVFEQRKRRRKEDEKKPDNACCLPSLLLHITPPYAELSGTLLQPFPPRPFSPSSLPSLVIIPHGRFVSSVQQAPPSPSFVSVSQESAGIGCSYCKSGRDKTSICQTELLSYTSARYSLYAAQRAPSLHPLFSVFCFLFSVLYSLFSALCILHSALYAALHSALYPQYRSRAFFPAPVILPACCDCDPSAKNSHHLLCR